MKRSADQVDDVGMEAPSSWRSRLLEHRALLAIVLVVALGGVVAVASFVLGFGAGAPTVQQATWDTEYYSENRTVAFVHSGGSTYEAATLRAQVEDRNDTFVASPEGSVDRGDRVLVRPVRPGEVVNLVHTEPDSGDEHVVYTVTAA